MQAPIGFATVAWRLAEQGWRPFPGRQETKIPAMKGWPGLNITGWNTAALAATIANFQPADAFCCCLAVQAEIVAIDLDVIDAASAAAAQSLADEILGETPLVRVGLAPKQVRIYRNAGNVRSRKLHPLEIFAGSGQIVGFGWHAKANGPYQWPTASPLNLSADSSEIPALTPAMVAKFSDALFQVVPRRLPLAHHSTHSGIARPQTIGDRLRFLAVRENSWAKAAAIILAEASEGYRNDTGWVVVASAAARRIPISMVERLFEQHFGGWDGFTRADLDSAIERAYRGRAPLRSRSTLPTHFGGNNVART